MRRWGAPAVQKLDVSGDRLSTHLCNIKLVNIQLQSTGMAALSKGLHLVHGLAHLDLTDNIGGSNSTRILAGSLAHLTGLTLCKLRGNSAGDQAAQ